PSWRAPFSAARSPITTSNTPSNRPARAPLHYLGARVRGRVPTEATTEVRMSSSTWAASFKAADISAMQIYDEVLVPRLFTPCGRLFIDRLELRPGESVVWREDAGASDR